MTAARTILLARVLAEPAIMPTLCEAQWATVVAQGHACALLPQLGRAIREQGLAASLPEGVMRHVRSAEVVARRQFQQALYEIGNVTEALRSAGCPAILLKGAAYVALGLSTSEGRNLSDIDVMVPRASLGAAESALMLAGWLVSERDPYNQRYYREWMHEIPPMTHMRRGSVVDLHHSILPLTARPEIDAGKLFAAARPVPGLACLRVLSPADMVLHSVTHLFHDGELDRGLRDLMDLHTLCAHYERHEPDFWGQLLARSRELGLGVPLYYGLRYAKAFLATPVPSAVEAEIAGQGGWLPKRMLMDSLFMRALRPNHPSCDDVGTPLARLLVYIRSHYLRMPLRLLIPHLARKFWMRHQALEAAAR